MCVPSNFGSASHLLEFTHGNTKSKVSTSSERYEGSRGTTSSHVLLCTGSPDSATRAPYHIRCSLRIAIHHPGKSPETHVLLDWMFWYWLWSMEHEPTAGCRC